MIPRGDRRRPRRRRRTRVLCGTSSSSSPPPSPNPLPQPLDLLEREMSVMMGFGGQGGPPGGVPVAATTTAAGSAELLYSPPHSLAAPHDSGIDMSPHEDSQQDLMVGMGGLPPTHSAIHHQEIEYHDASSSSDNSRASFSDALSMSIDDYSEGGSRGCPPHPVVEQRPPPVHYHHNHKSRRRRRSPPKATFDINDNSLFSVYTFFKSFLGASTASTVAIDNKIEQAMDLVKSHLMFAVREEVDVLKDRIVELMDRIKHLECENTILRQYASPEVLQQLQSQLPHQLSQPPHHSSTS